MSPAILADPYLCSIVEDEELSYSLSDIDNYKQVCRKEWGRVTPFRLGIIIGKLTGATYPNPYPQTSYANKHFDEGISFGILKRATGR